MKKQTVEIIRHQATIERILGHQAKIKLITESACASCHAKSACNPSDRKELNLTLNTHSLDYKEGEVVSVVMNKNMGLRAVVLAYILPFIVLITTLLLVINLTNNELWAVLASLCGIGFYYVVLYIFRQRISNSFDFTIEKIQ